MMGLIKYVAAVPTRVRSPFHAADFFAAMTPWSQGVVVPAGTEVQVLLDWRYTKLDPIDKETRYTPSTPNGYAEVIYHGHREGWRIQIDWVDDTRDVNIANDYQALRALNNHLRRGSVLWFPDFENYPNESVGCIADKIHAPKRVGALNKWGFQFDLMQLPAAQVPQSLPSFTTV
ncbi:MAG: hypothetical protein Q9N02_11515 [Ghiorsea sp.]|nr:hypothetical protein [Ghiorsea sp.]